MEADSVTVQDSKDDLTDPQIFRGGMRILTLIRMGNLLTYYAFLFNELKDIPC